jgi:Xaa-Pro aminopeptidase
LTSDRPGLFTGAAGIVQLDRIQHSLREAQLDGWLFFDHHARDPLAYRVLRFTPPRPPSRRWYYFIPASGDPRGLVHRIEAAMLNALPGPKTAYSSWREQVEGLRGLLTGARRIAMQYSPNCAIPYVANVDAGTVELVRSLGADVVSSADLIQVFEACWSPALLEMHLEAGRRVDQVRAEAFDLVRQSLRKNKEITEHALQQFVMKRLDESGLATDHGPIVAVNAHASDPHYDPVESRCSPIRPGDLLLLDLWAKLSEPDAVYYDITWMAFCGAPAPSEMQRVFNVVRDARDAGIRFVLERVKQGKPMRGFEVDDVVRGFIQQQGYGDYFTHRTGHSLGRETHGNGANMDNLETHDERRIIPWTCFTIEPGIYLPEFGVRSEVNVFVDDTGARVTGEVQRELVLLRSNSQP